MLSNRARLLIVMEMMEGGELFHRISQHRHFTEKQASQVTKQASGPGTSHTTVALQSRPVALWEGRQSNYIVGREAVQLHCGKESSPIALWEGRLKDKLHWTSHCLLCYNQKGGTSS